MIRSFVRSLLHSAMVDRSSPTRAVEYMLAWLTIMWGIALALPDDVITTTSYQLLYAIMAERWWSTFAIVAGSFRLVALIVNGSWKRTPILRLACAMLGLMGWLVVFALYVAGAAKGAAIGTPALMFPIFIFFEIYSCFRCGQDANSMNSLRSG